MFFGRLYSLVLRQRLDVLKIYRAENAENAGQRREEKRREEKRC